jgi:hypothetical protein
VQGANGTAGRRLTPRAPHGGNLTALTEPCGALPRKCLFVYLCQLASSCGTFGLSGNASLMEKVQLKVKTPSNQRHASAAGFSQGPHFVRSWRHTSGRRSRAKGYVCGNLSPSPNAGRNLFPCRVFLRSTESEGSMAQGGRLTQRALAPSALCALVRCKQSPLWGHYYYILQQPLAVAAATPFVGAASSLSSVEEITREQAIGRVMHNSNVHSVEVVPCSLGEYLPKAAPGVFE